MRHIAVVAATVLSTGLVWAVQSGPINKTCPIKGQPVKANITVEYKGKTIGFC